MITARPSVPWAPEQLRMLVDDISEYVLSRFWQIEAGFYERLGVIDAEKLQNRCLVIVLEDHHD